MTIHTSNFAHTCKAVNPVAISRTMPKGIAIPQYRPLMPSWSLLMDYRDHRITTEGYIRRYTEELSRLNRDRVLSDLRALTGSDTVTLICWEASGDFCHRHITKAWLEGRPFTGDFRD